MSRRKQGTIEVILVEDAPETRNLLLGLLQDIPDIKVVGTGFNGLDAVSLVKRLDPDVVIMDINLPKFDGLNATKQIMREAPRPIILITRSRISKDVDLSFKALRAGALSVLDEPSIHDEASRSKVVETIRLLADVPVIHHWRTPEQSPQASPVHGEKDLPDQVMASWKQYSSKIEVIGIAASTGGPSALVSVLSELPPTFPIPILVVQHITSGFMGGFKSWLQTQLHLEVAVAAQGDKLRPGVVYLAPDEYHMKVSFNKVIELSKELPYKGLRPSANPLFTSLGQVYRDRAMGVVLTGMGDDGADGAADLYKAKGLIVAQDQQSSVVYGMPREVKAREVVNHVLSLEQIASLLDSLCDSAGFLTGRSREKNYVVTTIP
jgi:two-component system chemotaxis response regulator CheB